MFEGPGLSRGEEGGGREQGGPRGGRWGAHPMGKRQGPGRGAQLPWTPGAGSVCGADARRAEWRPGSPGCWGNSGSGREMGDEGGAEPHMPALASRPCLACPGAQPLPLRTRAPKLPGATDTPAPPAARSAPPCWSPAGPCWSGAPRTAVRRHLLAYGEEAGHWKGAWGAQGVPSSSGPTMGLYRTWLQGQALWKRGRRWEKSWEPKDPSLEASNSAKKWVVRSAGPEDGAHV